jgi:hypothetical protein
MPVYDEPVFEAPTLTKKQGKYERVLEPLIASPEEWGKIGEYKTEDSAYQAALNLRHGRYKIPGSTQDWAFVSDGVKVYAQYLGETKATLEPPKRSKTAKKTAKKATKKVTAKR